MTGWQRSRSSITVPANFASYMQIIMQIMSAHLGPTTAMLTLSAPILQLDSTVPAKMDLPEMDKIVQVIIIVWGMLQLYAVRGIALLYYNRLNWLQKLIILQYYYHACSILWISYCMIGHQNFMPFRHASTRFCYSYIKLCVHVRIHVL